MSTRRNKTLPRADARETQHTDPFWQIAEARYSRRTVLKGSLGVGLAAALAACTGTGYSSGPAAAAPEKYPLGFAGLSNAPGAEGDAVPAGYTKQVLVRWGDPIMAGAPEFDATKLSEASQAGQFGYNCDFVAFMPLPAGSNSSTSGLLCVNNEYVNPELMFPGITSPRSMTKEQIQVAMQAVGHSIVEVRKTGSQWSVVKDSRYNRRLTATTAFQITGPAAGDARLKTKADPTGTRVLGTVNNCSGGVTPWGTVLSAEENFNFYFRYDAASPAIPEREKARNYAALGFGANPGYPLQVADSRFDLAQEPHEANRFGWVVEVDPYAPDSTPKKRTALGRFKHEAATCVISSNGKLVVYLGDDEADQYIYRYVSTRTLSANDRAGNAKLLDDGILSVAEFNVDGTITWKPLTYDASGKLGLANGFISQADVLIDTRRAAKTLGATPMDRPEDIEANPVTGNVYVVCTNNRNRATANAANPRPKNAWGHLVEMVPPGNGRDHHSAAGWRWNMFLMGGDPAANTGASYGKGGATWLSCPDNVAFDNQGRLWIATDGAPSAGGIADGLYACDVAGPERAVTKLFYRSPVGAEVCGPCFTPDNKTLFIAVQHPGEKEPQGPASTFEQPTTRWPDFKANVPPRPSVIAVTKDDGGGIGS